MNDEEFKNKWGLSYKDIDTSRGAEKTLNRLTQQGAGEDEIHRFFSICIEHHMDEIKKLRKHLKDTNTD